MIEITHTAKVESIDETTTLTVVEARKFLAEVSEDAELFVIMGYSGDQRDPLSFLRGLSARWTEIIGDT